MDTIAAAIEDKFVTIDGLRLRYLEQGSGPAIILLHGASLGSSADVFIRNLGSLAAGGWRAIAFDQPGFGLSDNPTDHGLAYRQQSILGLMDALGLETAVLVGHSQAGNFAFALVEDHPDRITRVIILGTGSLLPPLPSGDAKKKKAPAEGRHGTPQEPTIADTRKLLEATVFHHELITEDELALRHSRSVGKNFAAFLARAETRSPASKGGTPLWQRLAQSSVPSLLIYGREDRANAFERATLFKEQYPALNLHIIDGCKHLVPWDAADQWVRLALAFLKEPEVG
jgi:4,5:9,10-diseco-3-hydroxy-5,9,17-trioxoandrosta-1(10),2-diene-4-oate hydrolase